MAAKGSILKQEIANKILQTFPNSFLYNDGKEIRINGMEDGAPLQIKVVLTAAKVAVENEDFTSLPMKESVNEEDVFSSKEKVPEEPSEEEKERLKKLLSNLGF